MLPKTKPQLTKKCESFQENTTPFRKHGRKAYIRGYIHGYCNKDNMFIVPGRPNILEFVPFMEIIDIDWTSPSENRGPGVPATPSKKVAEADEAVPRKKRKTLFDPFGNGASASASNKPTGKDAARTSNDETIGSK
ncbi:MAG: hypothetical protein H7Y42_10715 [Chitinophagaceae bacterium]|nr:hypothetical protein [Chitinophagaceae bacterium]